MKEEIKSGKGRVKRPDKRNLYLSCLHSRKFLGPGSIKLLSDSLTPEPC